MQITEDFEDKALLEEARAWALTEDGLNAGTISAYIHGVLAERARQQKTEE